MTTELEKQQNGELYDAHDPIFKRYKDEANHFLMVYNQTPYDQADKRRTLLEQSLGSIGKNVTVGTPFLCDFARNIHLGDKISINMNCSLMDLPKFALMGNYGGPQRSNLYRDASSAPLRSVKRPVGCSSRTALCENPFVTSSYQTRLLDRRWRDYPARCDHR
ncbi:maltose acetyltransferase domain-containing protein [Secundilactobacillus silagei]|uniref:maltose acetyltransferase domain-containing protein n=1 Tax=Secundilactobacillus silagei TaxID=1293415 RepID=UPI000B21C8F1|nr:maltose acetyltransferase domain-containing protein [Secundilactobacillus silagei]